MRTLPFPRKQQPKSSQKSPSGCPSLHQLCRVFAQLDGLFCSQSPPRIPQLRFQEEERQGCWIQEAGKRLKKSSTGLEAPLRGLTQTLPTLSEGGGELESGPGTRRKDRTRVETAEWCQIFGGADLVKSGPGDSRGSRRGRPQDSILRMLNSHDRDCPIYYHLHFTDKTVGVQRGQAFVPGGCTAGPESRVPDPELVLLTTQAVPTLILSPRDTYTPASESSSPLLIPKQ